MLFLLFYIPLFCRWPSAVFLVACSFVFPAFTAYAHWPMLICFLFSSLLFRFFLPHSSVDYTSSFPPKKPNSSPVGLFHFMLPLFVFRGYYTCEDVVSFFPPLTPAVHRNYVLTGYSLGHTKRANNWNGWNGRRRPSNHALGLWR